MKAKHPYEILTDAHNEIAQLRSALQEILNEAESEWDYFSACENIALIARNALFKSERKEMQ